MDHRNKIEVPDPLAVEDLISSKLNNKRKLARLITQYRDIYCVISLANFRHYFKHFSGQISPRGRRETSYTALIKSNNQMKLEHET